jgi:hypothetical protein
VTAQSPTLDLDNSPQRCQSTANPGVGDAESHCLRALFRFKRIEIANGKLVLGRSAALKIKKGSPTGG